MDNYKRTGVDAPVLFLYNKAFKRDKDGYLYIDADLDRLHKPWPEYTDNDSITNPREIERIFAEHPELRKEYEGMKREYYDLHK